MKIDKDILMGIGFAILAVISFILLIKDKTKIVDDKLALKLRLVVMFLGSLCLSIIGFYKYFK